MRKKRHDIPCNRGKNIRERFEHSNNRRWDQVIKPVASSDYHRVSGRHALGGEQHNKERLRLWFERTGRCCPT